MSDFLKNLAALIKVKTIVTLVVVAVFAVLDLRRRGFGNAEIAAELNCSERTVNRLVRAIVDKIDGL